MKKLAESLGLNEEHMAAMIFLGHELYEEGKLDPAEKILAGLTVLDETNPYLFAVLGSVYEKEDKHREAVDSYTKALELYPQDIYSLTNRGEAYLHLQKFTGAASDFQEAIRLDPQGNHPAANRARLLVSLTRGALDLAVEEGTESVLEAKKLIDQQLSLQ